MDCPGTLNPRDPYVRCETYCTHDLAKAVLVSDELLARDGDATALAAKWHNGTGWLLQPERLER